MAERCPICGLGSIIFAHGLRLCSEAVEGKGCVRPPFGGWPPRDPRCTNVYPSPLRAGEVWHNHWPWEPCTVSETLT